MGAIVKPLDESSSYVYCPGCRDGGGPKAILRRDQHLFKCPANALHQFTWEQLQRFNAEMVPASEMVIEQPHPQAMAYKIYLIPETWNEFQQKFKGRTHITLATLIAALNAGQFVIVTGQDAAKLKAMGINNSTQMLAALAGIKQAEADRDTANTRLEQLLKMLKDAGVQA